MSKKTAPRRVKDNEAQAIGRSIRVSPRKLNLLAQLIRGRKVEDAITQLTFNRKRIAAEVLKVLQSAIANAENNHNLDVDRLVVAEATVGRSLVMKRWHARARGRGAPILKPFSRLTITVREREDKEDKKEQE